MEKPKPATNSKTSSIAGAELLDDMAAYIRRYLVCDDHQLTILTLWSACTHCHDHFFTAPYLHIRSAQPHSGRTVCLNLLSDLSDADICFTGILAAPLLDRLIQGRCVDEVKTKDLRRFPVLIDDYHHSFGPSEREPLVCLLASGSEITGLFCLGDDDYSLFSPKAFAGNFPLPKSLAARCIPIHLRRPRPTEKFVRYWPAVDTETVETLTDRLCQWLEQASSALEEASYKFPLDLPATLSPGQAKCAEPLVHIADTAGGAWPAKVRSALAAVFDLAEASPGLQMLSDVRTIFHDKNNPEYLATGDLLSQLRTLDSRPWSAWNSKSGQRLDGHLRPFGIMSRRLHLGSEGDFMGYLLTDFHDAWERYLPASSARLESERVKVSQDRTAVQAETTICAVGAD